MNLYEFARSVVAESVANGTLIKPEITASEVRRIKKKSGTRVFRKFVHDADLLRSEFDNYLAETPAYLVRLGLVVKHLRINPELTCTLFHEKGLKIMQGVQIKKEHHAELAELNAKWAKRNKEKEDAVLKMFTGLADKNEASGQIAKKLKMRKWLVTTILRKHDMFYFAK